MALVSLVWPFFFQIICIDIRDGSVAINIALLHVQHKVRGHVEFPASFNAKMLHLKLLTA